MSRISARLGNAVLPSLGFIGRVLVLDADHAVDRLFDAEQRAHVTLAPYRLLDAGLLARLQPDCVVAPLLGPGYDIVDLAEVLAALGYAGRLWAVGPKVPKPRLIAAEVRALAPGLKFELVEMTEDDGAIGPAG